MQTRAIDRPATENVGSAQLVSNWEGRIVWGLLKCWKYHACDLHGCRKFTKQGRLRVRRYYENGVGCNLELLRFEQNALHFCVKFSKLSTRAALHIFQTTHASGILARTTSREPRVRLDIGETVRCLQYPYSFAGASWDGFSCKDRTFGSFIPGNEGLLHRSGHNYEVTKLSCIFTTVKKSFVSFPLTRWFYRRVEKLDETKRMIQLFRLQSR